MKAGHRLQQEHRDKSSLFSPSEFAESANWICCLLFCFRWAVVFPWKMPLFFLQVWATLSPDYYHQFWNSYSTMGQPCLVIFVLLHDCFTYTVLCSHICTPQASEWPVSVQSRSLWLQKILSAGSELLENHWEVLPPRAAAGLCRLHRTGPINQLSSSSNLFVLLAVLCTY